MLEEPTVADSPFHKVPKIKASHHQVDHHLVNLDLAAGKALPAKRLDLGHKSLDVLKADVEGRKPARVASRRESSLILQSMGSGRGLA